MATQITRLQKIAHRVMLERGLSPDFPQAVLDELDKINSPSEDYGNNVKDLRAQLWCSIDNDDSRDLDQLTVAQQLNDGKVKIFIAIADVDGIVKKDSAIDLHASQNTTSVYTPAIIFPMLPEKLSTNLTSLNDHEDRVAVVIEIIIKPDGNIGDSSIYRAMVKNKAKLAYSYVGPWLENKAPMPEPVKKVPGLSETLIIQDKTAQLLKKLRTLHGALSFETIEPKAEFKDNRIVGMYSEPKNRAHQLIEDFMIAANGVTARYLAKMNFPSIRRVVRVPKRWDRIVDLANDCCGEPLPAVPDSKALEEFLLKMKNKDPLRFPDLSLSVIKLMGSGEYIAEDPGEDPIGHFGLAVQDYSHSTAPNRRYPDVITQRLLKSALKGEQPPYTKAELDSLASQCTYKEDIVNKVERSVRKSAAAMLLENKINEQFEAIVTGSNEKGIWVRLFDPPVEGKLVQGFVGIDVGDRITVKLVHVDVNKGFIDFARVAKPGKNHHIETYARGRHG